MVAESFQKRILTPGAGAVAQAQWDHSTVSPMRQLPSGRHQKDLAARQALTLALGQPVMLLET